MGDLYLRKVKVDVIPQTGLGKTIDGLRVKFKVEKTNESKPNDAMIEIFNLSDETRSMFEAKNTKIRLSVGYLGLNPDGVLPGTGLASSSSVEQIFIGDVSKVLHQVNRPDIITNIQAADGENKYRNARLDKGFPPNTKLKDVLLEMVDSMGLSSGPLGDIPDVKYAHGVSFSGLSRDHLDTLAHAHKLEWSIQDETVQIIPQDSGTLESIIFLSPDSGLIGSPNKTDKGVEFSSLIQPKLRPGRRVQLESRFLKGIFKIRKVTHDGDSNQGDFLSKVETTK